MFKGHPKGLYVAFVSNMGERYGFYTMMAVLVLYLQARYGLSVAQAGIIYSVFYFLMYALTLLGGWVADRWIGLHKTILWGIVTKTVGYSIMMIPGMGLPVTVTGLLITSLGNGLFKGNLQAMVGNLYENKQYRHLRDSGFSIFYMGINIGAFFAPSTATFMRNWYLKSHGFGYDSSLPEICHRYKESLLAGTHFDTTVLSELATKVSGALPTDLGAFSDHYIQAFSAGYNLAFAVAAGAMFLSLAVYLGFRKHLLPANLSTSEDATTNQEPGTTNQEPGTTNQEPGTTNQEPATPAERQVMNTPQALSPASERKRLIALGWIMLIVIFFWMSFHQNGLTMTFFARDYTVQQVSRLDYLVFDIRSTLALVAALGGLFLLFRRSAKGLVKLAGGVLSTAGAVTLVFLYRGYDSVMPLNPEIFQQFNPIFVVACTPLIVGLFSYLNRKGKEPSATKKIGIGMVLTALSFFLLVVCSVGLPSPGELNGAASPERVGPYWLFWSYFIITWGELFLNPMGISFVSKISPPRFRGLMQGAWLCTVAVGNQLLFVGSSLWTVLELWQLWLIFVVCCLISATIIFALSKKLDRLTA